MISRRFILHGLALATASCLVSCIDGREEIWLHADGSGRADFAYSLPAAAAGWHGGADGVRRMIEGFLHGTPEISASSCEVATEADRLVIRVRTSFDSAMALEQILHGPALAKLPASAADLAGQVTVQVHGLNLDFSRTIAPGKALPGSSLMPASRFEGRNLTYIMHLPQSATESNATRTEDAGRTLIWDFPLARAVENPVTTRFKTRIPIPAWLAVAGSLAAVLAAALGIHKLRRVRQAER